MFVYTRVYMLSSNFFPLACLLSLLHFFLGPPELPPDSIIWPCESQGLGVEERQKLCLALGNCSVWSRDASVSLQEAIGLGLLPGSVSRILEVMLRASVMTSCHTAKPCIL